MYYDRFDVNSPGDHAQLPAQLMIPLSPRAGTTGNGIAGDDNELSDSNDSSSDSNNDTVQNCNESLTDPDPAPSSDRLL